MCYTTQMRATKVLHAENLKCFEMPSFNVNKSMASHACVLIANLNPPINKGVYHKVVEYK